MSRKMLDDEDDDIESIKRTLEEAGVENIDPDAELNIDLAEYEGFPPERI